ncbi:FHA domain-containing protein [Gilvimarinus sp. F26214L]|uniref:FHA domain-containing protein n=1 Tax=Gilvimarinus sp. DZF01 TaxID=3461371 RepID=UPI00404549B8
MAILAQLVEDVVTHRFEIADPQLTIGRHPSNDVQIDEEAVSGKHALIIAERNAFFSAHKEYFLEDLGSTNGTFVNGERINGRVRLQHNDLIRMAWTQFKFMEEQETGLEKTVHMIG